MPVDLTAACIVLEPALMRAFRDARVRGTLVGEHLYPVGTDSKQLSSIFEQIAAPSVQAFARATGRQVFGASQTAYPDFTIAVDESDMAKIALDVKCAYRRPGGGMFTMGSYGSYLRDGTTGIRFPYHHYAAHWVIGILYTRNPDADAAIEPLPANHPVGHPVPFTDVEVFIEERHRITDIRIGSGNTRNYGSIRGNKAEDFLAGGPFADYPPEVAAGFWAAFPEFRTIEAYLAARGGATVELHRPRYDEQLALL